MYFPDLLFERSDIRIQYTVHTFLSISKQERKHYTTFEDKLF